MLRRIREFFESKPPTQKPQCPRPQIKRPIPCTDDYDDLPLFLRRHLEQEEEIDIFPRKSKVLTLPRTIGSVTPGSLSETTNDQWDEESKSDTDEESKSDTDEESKSDTDEERGIDSMIFYGMAYQSEESIASEPISTADRSTEISYKTTGGRQVHINFPMDPWNILDLPSDASRGAVKQAFREKIKDPQLQDQDRALVSLAKHILTSTEPTRYQHEQNDLFSLNDRDHFTIAAYGNTHELKVLIRRDNSLLTTTDEHGRTLLYLACKSGFYGMVRMLLREGADINTIQRDGSTPLHAASFYGHPLVVSLLLEYGARTDIKNTWASTALEESDSTEITNLIEDTSSDFIFSTKATLMEKKLVSRMRPIEFKGQLIAKELLRDPSRFDERTKSELNTIRKTWKMTWHGTQFQNLESILTQGLLPAGSEGISPPPGHFELGQTFQGVENWAAAIFLSPSIMYSSHEVYSERVTSTNEEWCVLIKAYCRPGSYTAYDPTVFSYEGMVGEPAMPEYRVPFTLDGDCDDEFSPPGDDEDQNNVVLRVESARNVVVYSVMFVRASALENQEMIFDELPKLFNK